MWVGIRTNVEINWVKQESRKTSSHWQSIHLWKGCQHIILGEVIVSSTKQCWNNIQKDRIGSLHYSICKNIQNWIKIPNLRAKTRNSLEENMGVNVLWSQIVPWSLRCDPQENRNNKILKNRQWTSPKGKTLCFKKYHQKKWGEKRETH